MDHSTSAAHDRLAEPVAQAFSSGFHNISNPAPWVGSFTPTADATYEVGVSAGSVVTGGGGALRIVLRLTAGVGGPSYPADVFNNDAFPPPIQSAPAEHVFGTVALLGGVTYGISLGGGGGTTGGNAECFIRPV